MKQVIQTLRKGDIKVEEIPTPNIAGNQVLIKTVCSLLSVGTERMLVDFGRSNMLEKARNNPDRVKQVFDKVKTEGLVTTVDAVMTKLDSPMPLGYCNAGYVIAVGDNVKEFNIGDRVVSNGSHAEVVRVPKNLCAKIPDNVDFKSASFTVISSIAMQSVRLAKPTIGETFVVIGLGLIGLITCQILRANGCQVIGVELDQDKCKLANKLGINTVNPAKGEIIDELVNKMTNNIGADGVIIAASTKGSEIVHDAARVSRKRGRIIMVGVTGMELRRDDFYEKELSFQVSCSYGPGRYDDEYEQLGHDYPVGFVRWTEKRNFESILQLLASKKLKTDALVSKSFNINDAADAYDFMLNNKCLGVLIEYNKVASEELLNAKTVRISDSTKNPVNSIAMIGCGNYATRILLPALKKSNCHFHTIVSDQGVSGNFNSKKYGFEFNSTDINNVLENKDIDTVIVTTRHSTHADIVIRSLKSGKNVYVEKPLCLTLDELESIENTYNSTHFKDGTSLTVGFNRRYAPLVTKAVDLLSGSKEAKILTMNINAGFLPSNHWLNTEDGGGRLVGEACHFIDLARYIIGHEIIEYDVYPLVRTTYKYTQDFSILLRFKDESSAIINYISNGNSRVSKERIEITSGGKSINIDNYRKLVTYGFRGKNNKTLWSMDKGQQLYVNEFVNTKSELIPFSELKEVMYITLMLEQILQNKGAL